MLRLFWVGFLLAALCLLFLSVEFQNLITVRTINDGRAGGRLTKSQSATMRLFSRYLSYHTCRIRNHTYTMLEAPSLVIAGAQKAGTTAMAHLLEKHPAVLSSQQEEAHFFDL